LHNDLLAAARQLLEEYVDPLQDWAPNWEELGSSSLAPVEEEQLPLF
jgi:hypothetical protein